MSEREKRSLRREGAGAAVDFIMAMLRKNCGNREDVDFVESQDFRNVVGSLFPLPKIERPRVVKDKSDYSWRIVEGDIEWCRNFVWNSLARPGCEGMYITAERAILLADLIARPCELVDDEGGES